MLPQIWTPGAATERKRRLMARRYPVVRHRTRIKNEVHSILHAQLIAKCPHGDLFNGRGRTWLARQPLPDDERSADERSAIERHVCELDRLAEGPGLLDREIAQFAIEDPAIKETSDNHGHISKIGRSYAPCSRRHGRARGRGARTAARFPRTHPRQRGHQIAFMAWSVAWRSKRQVITLK